MVMIVVNQLDQNSDSWHRWRGAGIGSSDAAKICNLSPYGKARDVYLDKILQKRGRPAKRLFTNSAMRRGTNLEPKIRKYIEGVAKCKLPPVCGYREDYSWCRASFDGYDASKKLIIEIKAPKREDHQNALDGKLPNHYWPQVHHQLLVSEADECWYCSYSDYFEAAQQLAIVKISRKREAEGIAGLLSIEQEFWHAIETETWPIVQ